MMTKMVINPNRKLSRINRQIYGHFSEHLGRCIYEGIYVGKNSPIENVNGIERDSSSSASLAWRMFCR